MAGLTLKGFKCCHSFYFKIRINHAYHPNRMKRILACILILAAQHTSFSAEITKETPIAFYSITDLAESNESAIYTASLLRQMSDIIEKTVNLRPDLFDNQPATFLIEVLPSGFVRTVVREDGDPTYGITDSINEVMGDRHWCFIPFWAELDKENQSMAKTRLIVHPKCLIISAERTVIFKDSMSLEGDAQMSYGKYKIGADKIAYNSDQRVGTASGSVLLNIASGEYKHKKEIKFVFNGDGALSNYFWEGYAANGVIK